MPASKRISLTALRKRAREVLGPGCSVGEGFAGLKLLVKGACHQPDPRARLMAALNALEQASAATCHPRHGDCTKPEGHAGQHDAFAGFRAHSHWGKGDDDG